MYQLNEIEMWREHRRELLREADGQRCYRRPGSAKRKETSLAGGVRRIFSVMAVGAVIGDDGGSSRVRRAGRGEALHLRRLRLGARNR